MNQLLLVLLDDEPVSNILSDVFYFFVRVFHCISVSFKL